MPYDLHMAADNHFPTLVGKLKLEHFIAYLNDNGWREIEEAHNDRLRFELAGESHPYVLMLPSSNQASQVRKQMQFAVFNLSGIEDRQPIEIVRDMLTATIQPPAVAPSTGTIRLKFRNLQAGTMILKVATRPDANTLMPGEAIEIVCPASSETIEIGFGTSAIEIDDQSVR